MLVRQQVELARLRNASASVGLLFGLALLFALLAGGYFLVRYVVNVFAALDPQAEILAAIASAVALLCAVIIAEGLKARGEIAVDPAANVATVELYERVLLGCCERLNQPGGAAPTTMDADLARVERLLVLRGGPQVVSAYVDFRRATEQEATGTLLKRLVAEMRADLGRELAKDNDVLDLLLRRN